MNDLLAESPPLTTKTLIWQDRLVKMLDPVTWACSRAGDHNDWDFCPESVSDAMPIAGNLENAQVYDFEVVDNNNLRFKTHGGPYLLHHCSGGWRIDWESGRCPKGGLLKANEPGECVPFLIEDATGRIVTGDQQVDKIGNDGFNEALWVTFNAMMAPVPKSLFPSDDDVKPDHIVGK